LLSQTLNIILTRVKLNSGGLSPDFSVQL